MWPILYWVWNVEPFSSNHSTLKWELVCEFKTQPNFNQNFIWNIHPIPNRMRNFGWNLYGDGCSEPCYRNGISSKENKSKTTEK